MALQLLPGGDAHRARQMQATAQNPTVARILGVPVERMILYTFLINAALVGAGLAADHARSISPSSPTARRSAWRPSSPRSSAASTRCAAPSSAACCSASSTISPPPTSRPQYRRPCRCCLLIVDHPVPAAGAARPHRGAHGMRPARLRCWSLAGMALVLAPVDLAGSAFPIRAQALRHLHPQHCGR